MSTPRPARWRRSWGGVAELPARSHGEAGARLFLGEDLQQGGGDMHHVAAGDRAPDREGRQDAVAVEVAVRAGGEAVADGRSAGRGVAVEVVLRRVDGEVQAREADAADRRVDAPLRRV